MFRMAFKLGAEMMVEIAVSALNKGRCVVLVKTPAQAEKVSVKVRSAIRDELLENPGNYVVRGRGNISTLPLLRPLGNNPSFIQVSNGGWVFVWPADDMEADEAIGDPQFVYWPSEGGSYEKVTYALWKLHRLAGTIYRPIKVAPPRKTVGPRTAWDRLMVDEDDP